MKNTILITLVSLSAWTIPLPAQEIIAQWNFNDETPSPSTGAGPASPTGGTTATFAAGSGSDHAATGNKGWNITGFPAPGKIPRTAGVQFAVSTADYEQIVLTFDQRFSATASRAVVVQYATDGTNFLDALVFTAPGDTWTNGVAIDLSGIAGADNNPQFVVRIVSDFADGEQYLAVKTGSNYSPAGTWRFDMVTVAGTPVGGASDSPVIRTQPLSLLGQPGGTVTFAVTASGSPPLRYQWWFRDAVLGDATTATLTLADISKANEGAYYVVISNAVDTVKSEVVTLTVAVPLVVQFTNVLEHLVRPGDVPTNTFAEHALRPGERLTMTVAVWDPSGGLVTVQPDVASLPPGARWSFDTLSGPAVTGVLQWEPAKAAAGNLHAVTLLAWGAVVTNTAVWNVYVPTVAEQGVVLTEYLANPTAATTAPFFNPLRRDPPASNPGTQDEYLELVNLSDTPLELESWTVADAVQVRHQFRVPFTLASSNAVVVYGGPQTGSVPGLDVPCEPASESSAGLALNNSGDTIMVRNASSNLVLRVVYTSKMVASDGAMTRYPDANGPFVPASQVATLPVSPGYQYDGRPWSEPSAPAPVPIEGLAIVCDTGGAVTLMWQAEPGRTYSVWAAAAVDGVYDVIASHLTTGRYSELNRADGETRFFRVSAP